MKKTNKGFSLVELIIVIAIMAILAGALAPQLIKYINKSRLSSDVQTGSAIQSAVQAALANEDAYDKAETTYDGKYTPVSDLVSAGGGTGSDRFAEEVVSALGNNKGTGKAKKDIDGNGLTDQNFYVYLDLKDNKVEVYYGTGATKPTDDSQMVSPTAGSKMVKK